jgi:HEAT repeat protein
MPEARKLTVSDLNDIVSDADERVKGMRLSDQGGLAHLSRYEGKLFADAAGSGASPYKVQIVFDDAGKVKGRCSCMAARSRPFCKHATALLVTWVRSPEAFVVSETAPTPSPGDAKKKAVKTGKTDAAAMMGQGVAQAGTLVRELAVAGVASLAEDRVEQVRALGESLREARLRRLSARIVELSDQLARAAARTDSFDASDYADLLGDMLLTVRKLEKHLAGEPLADEHVEELIGKTWTKKDRKPIEGLDLVEYSFATRTTPDDFVIRESRLFELHTGDHYTEKQILPAFLANAPKRLDLGEVGEQAALGEAALQELITKALPDVGAALTALQDRRKDVFAPDELPVALRAEGLLADGGRLQVVDAKSAALFLPDDTALEDRLAAALRNSKMEVLLGDVMLDGALPTLNPLAVVTRTDGRLELTRLGGVDIIALLKKRRRGVDLTGKSARKSKWADVARRVGASTAAIALGEVREEMAEQLATGLASVSTRAVEPLVSRLRDLSLAKQADLLAAIAQRQDPAEKLDDFVKLHQVLGIALARLAGATHVDQAVLERVPTFESVLVRRPARLLAPQELAAEQGAGRMNRYEAAIHYARHYESLSTADIAASMYPAWADGSASPFIARAMARDPVAAVEAARRALGLDAGSTRRAQARVTRLTAIRVLALVGTREARGALAQAAREHRNDPALAAHAQRALRAVAHEDLPWSTVQEMTALMKLALTAPQSDARAKAVETLGQRGVVEAIPVLRTSFLGDATTGVRAEAAYALARVGDVESVDAFLRIFQRRATDGQEAKVAAYALGILGDARGLDALLQAYAEGWQPGIVAAALAQIGPAALWPLLTLVEGRPEIIERKAALGVVGSLPADEVVALVAERLASLEGTPEFFGRAALYLTFASGSAEAANAVAKRIMEILPDILTVKKPTAEQKALVRILRKVGGDEAKK